MKKLLFILLAIGVFMTHAGTAAAHVFFTDQTGEHGVTMHILPDDDPIAGQSSTMFFDIKSDTISTETYNIDVFIIDQSGNKQLTTTTVTGSSSVMSVHTFPIQGIYEIRLEASQKSSPGASFVFTYSQRISRGFAGSALDQARYSWAEFGMLASLTGIVLVFLFVVLRRRQILGYTKWN